MAATVAAALGDGLQVGLAGRLRVDAGWGRPGR